MVAEKLFDLRQESSIIEMISRGSVFIEALISDVQSALDFMMTVNYETGSHAIVINKKAIIEDFFVLSTKIAGEILQKFVTYQFKLAIAGDFSSYTSKPLKDFIYECNKGKDIFFVSTEEEAIEKLSRA